MLFGPPVPDGLLYRPDFRQRDEERDLVAAIEQLEFSQVEMRGAIARRRTVHYGWTYGYYARRSEPGPPLPAFLLPAARPRRRRGRRSMTRHSSRR